MQVISHKVFPLTENCKVFPLSPPQLFSLFCFIFFLKYLNLFWNWIFIQLKTWQSEHCRWHCMSCLTDTSFGVFRPDIADNHFYLIPLQWCYWYEGSYSCNGQDTHSKVSFIELDTAHTRREDVLLPQIYQKYMKWGMDYGWERGTKMGELFFPRSIGYLECILWSPCSFVPGKGTLPMWWIIRQIICFICSSLCGGLTLTGHQLPSKMLYHSHSSTEQEGKYNKKLMGGDRDGGISQQLLPHAT